MAEDGVRKYYVFALKAFADVLGTILVPALTALGIRYACKLPDGIFLAILGGVFVLTAVVLAKKIRSYGRSFQQLTESDRDELRGPRS